MTPMVDELEHPQINIMFELEKEMDETFILEGKLFLNFGLNENKAQGTSRSSELKVKARLRRVEKYLASVKDDVRAFQEDQKHMMANLKNYENILQKLNWGYDINDQDNTGMGKREKEVEKIIDEEKLERGDVDDREQFIS
ncbi:hypothetical protein PanWU01x14_184180 [Parasponia andersonii]|uniref:Uncharacterized protein n=1 Tax=Parasponia andersonii TaxID=3476 RepID=A0A2P5C4W6_PARAD|nr:hypothetical protein PanWU01x14_184180 [Parasponia andersonii]